jgi:prolyl-tRNA editing enzyme YbaK/EbsC (Cys-tRNA(Pro) deacylase)
MTLSPSAQRVQEALTSLGIQAQVQELSQSTRTAEDAAKALGVTVGQIVKSLVFLAGDLPLLIEASGKNRVDLTKIKTLLGVSVRQANADEVKRFTSYPIGGVPPIGHPQVIQTLIDEDLLRYDVIYAAAGTPFAVFRTTPHDLLRMTQGRVIDVRQE